MAFEPPSVSDPRCRVILKAVFDGFGGGDSQPTVMGVQEELVPIRASVHFNGYKDAGWSVSFDATAFPFSPEVIRNMAVAILMYGLKNPQDDESSYLTDPASIMIEGLADDVDWEPTSNVFTVTGRDYTALLTGKTWNPETSGKNGRVPVGRPLDETVQALVNEAVVRIDNTTGTPTKTATLTVRYVGLDPVPMVGGSLYKTKTKRGISVQLQGGRNYWDVIYGVCLKHAKICFVRGTEVIISDPKTLTVNSMQSIPGTPQSLAAAAAVAQQAIRYTAYGRNLKSLKIARHMGNEQVPQIIACSYDPETQQQIQAKYPPGDKVDISKKTGLGTRKDTEEYVTAPPGIRDLKVLEAFAEAYYHHKARAEMKARLETADLVDLLGTSFLTIRPGDAVSVHIDPYTEDDLSQLTVGERIERLLQAGYAARVANVIAQYYEQVRVLKRPLYTSNVQLDWELGSGGSGGSMITMVEALNFVAVQREGDVRPPVTKLGAT